jgi:dynactin 1
MTAIKVGQTVETTSEQQGVVRYVGAIHVSDGVFIGIELSTPTGKNDGSVRGERYFSCAPGHGLFIRDSSITQILSEAPAPSSRSAAASTQQAPTTTRPRAPTNRARPTSVAAPKTPSRASAVTRRQSVAPAASNNNLRTPARTPSTASATTAPSEPSVRPAPSSSRHSLSSSTAQNATKTSRDSNVEALQTTIRHFEKQHSEDQDRLKDVVQIKDERDRYHGIIQKLQEKCQTFHQNATDMKTTTQALQSDNDRLTKDQQEHETDLELALLDKEMAEERAEIAEADLESLRGRLRERDLEVEILRDEAQLYTAEMTEEEKQEAGYYRLQHDNERLRHALLVLKEVTENTEQDLKARVAELEEDVAKVETLKQENITLQERLTSSESIIEHLREQLNDADETEDIIGDLSTQNQDLKEAIAEKDMAIQDLENLKDLNDELEIQRAEEAEDLRTELRVKDFELVDYTTRLSEQATVITEQDDIINKFRALITELQSKMVDAESSKMMTQAEVNNTTGRFNEIMDMNRRLRAATVEATTKEITADLKGLFRDEAVEKLEIWIETGSKEFGNSESLKAYFSAKRIAYKCRVLRKQLVTLSREKGSDVKPEQALSMLACSKAISYLAVLKTGSEQIWSAITVLSLEQFATIGVVHQDLLTIEKTLDQGLDALKADEVDFDELAGSFSRSTKLQTAIINTRQEFLAALPEDELHFRVKSIFHRLQHLTAIFDLADWTLHKAPEAIGEQCQRSRRHLKEPSDHVKAGIAAAEKLISTLEERKHDGMYPVFPTGLDSIVQQDEELVQAVEALTAFADKLISEIGKYASLTEPKTDDTKRAEALIGMIDSEYIDPFYSSGLHDIYLKIRHWTDLALVLMNNIEIEHRPAPWTEKAFEVEAAKKKTEEAARQLETLTAEHRATVLKIHEREQVIATKELEIEHLLAKNRDISSRTQEVELLREERDEAHAKIMQLLAQDRAQVMELEAMRERLAHIDQYGRSEADPAADDTTAGAESVEQVPVSRTVPAGHIALLAALRNDNRWLRRRVHSDIFHQHLNDLLESMETLRSFDRDDPAPVPKDENRTLEPVYLTDDNSEDDSQDSSDDDSEDIPATEDPVAISRASSPGVPDGWQPYGPPDRYIFGDYPEPGRHKMSPLTLSPVRVGWSPRSRSPRVAFEEAEEEYLTMSAIIEDSDDEPFF